MKAHNAFAYFNAGFKAGASIPHKHIQLIPYKSMRDGMLPVEQEALKYAMENNIQSGMFQLPQFKTFKHVFHVLADSEGKSIMRICEDEHRIEELAHRITLIYNECLQILKYKEEDYNMVLTEHFLFVVLREKESFTQGEYEFNINALGYAGTLAVKS